MSLFSKLFGNSSEQENYESFMAGYRNGCPTEEDSQSSSASNGSEYQRGYTAGREVFSNLQAEHPDLIRNGRIRHDEETDNFCSVCGEDVMIYPHSH